MPGKIFPVTIDTGKSFIAKRESFLACEEGVELDIALTKKLGAGFVWRGRVHPPDMSGKGICFPALLRGYY